MEEEKTIKTIEEPEETYTYRKYGVTKEEIREELNNLINSDLTMDLINEIPMIVVKMKVYCIDNLPKEVKECPSRPPLYYNPGENTAEEEYKRLVKKLENIVIDKLSNILTLSPATLEKIAQIIVHREVASRLKNIYALDNEYVLGVSENDVNKYFSTMEYYHCPSDMWFGCDVPKEYKLNFINAINSLVRSLPINIESNRKLLYEDKKIGIGNDSGLSIVFNHTLNEMVEDKDLVTNVIISSNDNLYLYWITRVGNNFEIIDLNETIINLKNELEKAKGRKK